jgi:hypothetical protein
MSKGRQAFCRTDVLRAIKAIKDAGLPISAVRISPLGEIEVETAKTQAQDSSTDLERWLNGRGSSRVHLKGINSHTAKLADSKTKTYWHAWKGGPRLQGEPGTPEFIASYNEAASQKLRLQSRTPRCPPGETAAAVAPRSREAVNSAIVCLCKA